MFADDILGDYETRYFGAGHKRTSYKLKGSFPDCRAEVFQTDGWSVKDGCQMKPHLSTIDGIILAVMYVEKHMKENNVHILLDSFFLYAFEIKSGVMPVEDLMDVSLDMKKEEILEKKAYFEVVVGGMAVKLKFKSVKSDSYNNDCCIQEMDNDNAHYFSEHLKNVKHNVGDISFGENSIACVISREEMRNVSYNGIGKLLANTISILEWLIIFSQMGQLLAYEIDSINRQESETLWMKNIKAEMDLLVTYKKPLFVSGGIVKSSLLNIKSKMWRIFEMAGSADNGNVRFEGKIAHILPDSKKEVAHE